MTIVVAVRDEERAETVLMSDSMVSYGDGTGVVLDSRGPIKIGRNSSYLIGVAGRLRTGQVLQASPLPAPPTSPGTTGSDIDHFVITELARHMQANLQEGGVEQIIDNERVMTESEMIVVVEGMPYTIGEDYSALRGERLNNFSVCAIGSGFRIALGAAYGLLSSGENVEALTLATTMCMAAIRWDQGCGGNLHYIQPDGEIYELTQG